VNRLPPEILSRIAGYVPNENARDTRSIIPLTHVCRYWRESIVSTPENWTLISSERIGLTQLSVERCKAAPLKIWSDMRQVKRNPWFSDLLTPHIQTTETLRFNHISVIEELVQTLPNFPQSMPNLRSLTLSGPWNAGWDWSTDPFGPLTPPLTHLSLSDIPLYPSFLHLRTLTDLTLRSCWFNLHLDTLLDFLEGNHSLERATLDITFAHSSLRSSQGRTVTGNRLRRLSICSYDAMDNKALISSIPLQRDADLEMSLCYQSTGLNDVLSLISTYLSDLQSPAFMEYHPDKRTSIRLSGPNGSFSASCLFGSGIPFAEFPLLPLTNIREFRLIRRTSELEEFPLNPTVFPPSSLPALEALVIEREITPLQLLSTLFSNPSSSPSLKTLAFFNCDLDEGFMEALTRFASNRKNTTSAWLYRVVVVSSKGDLPSVTSIDVLGDHVPVVDARIGKKLPTDLV